MIKLQTSGNKALDTKGSIVGLGLALGSLLALGQCGRSLASRLAFNAISMNPYTPSLASSDRSDPQSRSLIHAIFSGWFSMRTLVAFASIGIGGFGEGIVRPGFSYIAMLVSVVFGLRHFSKLSPVYAMVRLISEVAIVYSIMVVIWIALLMYLAMFVPDAFSH